MQLIHQQLKLYYTSCLSPSCLDADCTTFLAVIILSLCQRLTLSVPHKVHEILGRCTGLFVVSNAVSRLSLIMCLARDIGPQSCHWVATSSKIGSFWALNFCGANNQKSLHSVTLPNDTPGVKLESLTHGVSVGNVTLWRDFWLSAPHRKDLPPLLR